MTPQKKSEWKPETFPQPRTIPTGWETSAFFMAADKEIDEAGDSVSSSEEVKTDWVPEKFPKPRTYPKNWSIDD
jgi:hypothetical protein